MPPPPLAVFPKKVVLNAVRFRAEWAIPPPASALFDEMLQLFIVRSPLLRMPPPEAPLACPFAIVRPEMDEVTLSNSNTRLALFPLTVKFAAPGPLMLTLFVIVSCPLVSVIVPVTPVEMPGTLVAKLIAVVFVPGLALTALMASRREQWAMPGTPSSTSFVELTMKTRFEELPLTTQLVWTRSCNS